MSTSPAAAGVRRKAEDVRREALEVGRDLLVRGGPAALTLKAVGTAMGMSHANLIHHFGSAEAFQFELKGFMTGELTQTIKALVETAERADVGVLVDRVFDAYAAGGIGVLMAWSALGGGGEPQSLEAVSALVTVLEAQIVGPERERRAREIVCLVTATALANSLIGAGLAANAHGDPHAMRSLTVRLATQLRDVAPVTPSERPEGARS